VKFVSTVAPAWKADNLPIYGGFFWINADGALPVPKNAYYMNGAGNRSRTRSSTSPSTGGLAATRRVLPSALQKVGNNDEVMASWAHASNTPGDPGAASVDNTANMVAGGYRHWFKPKATVYVVYAHLSNAPAAHYALGPGGHGVTWDCKDGSGPSTARPGGGMGFVGNGTGCFTGTTIQAYSLGMTYDF